MERSWHGYGTLNLSVGSLGSSSQPWWRSISCGYALNINNILISYNILKFEIRIYSSHGNIYTTKYETTNQPWFKPMFTRICRASTPHVLGGSTGSPSLILNPPLTVQLWFQYHRFGFVNEPNVLLRKLLKNISVSPLIILRWAVNAHFWMAKLVMSIWICIYNSHQIQHVSSLRTSQSPSIGSLNHISHIIGHHILNFPGVYVSLSSIGSTSILVSPYEMD